MKNIILLHGALGAAEDLYPLSCSLKNEAFSTHSFSFSGHSNTAFGTSFGIGQFAEELEIFILENNLKNTSVFGYSMGGFIAIYLASKQPALIRNIVTLGTKFNWSAEAIEKETKMLNPEMIMEKVPAFARSLEAKHGHLWKDLLQKTADLMREIGQKEFLNAEVLKTLNTPLLLGIADKDQMVSLDETVTVFKTLPKAAMYMLPQTKHQLESVNVSLLSKVIFDFVSRS